MTTTGHPRGEHLPADEPTVVPSGVSGLDVVLAGGYAGNRVHLIEGAPGAGKTTMALHLADEALRTLKARNALREWIDAQPSWSDFPFVLLTSRQSAVDDRNSSTGELLGNATLLERPLHPITLASAVRQAIRARRRQRAAGLVLEAREQAEAALRAREADLEHANETLERRVEERIAELAAANRQLVAQIAERERVEDALRQAQRLEAVGQLTSGVAHDFNNLLTVVLGNIEFLERNAGNDPKARRRLGNVRTAAERGASLTAQLLAFSRRQRLEPKPVDVNKTVSSMSGLLRSTMGGAVRLETILRPDVWPALADETQIEMVILNLAINARDAMSVGGNLSIETANIVLGEPSLPEEPAAGEYVMVCVSDTGSGMPEEVLARAFEPFFTTKEVGKGSGLGLPQVYGFAKQSGGGVKIETANGEGTSVKVYLPRAAVRASSELKSAGESDRLEARQATLVLVVDDDSAVREVTVSMLQELGYSVLEAGSGGAALDALDQEPRIDLMLLDYAMPGMNGAVVARQAMQRRPSLPILFVTGYADLGALDWVGEDRIVQKPFRGDELGRKLQAVLGEADIQPNVVSFRQAAPG